MDVPTFRGDFPEFADSAQYPDARVQFFISLAGKLLAPQRWDASLIGYGTELFVAHHLSLSGKDQAAAANGGQGGAASGVVAGKSVDRVSVSYDTRSIALGNAGHWNMTSYGIRFLQLARMAGAGGVQL